MVSELSNNELSDRIANDMKAGNIDAVIINIPKLTDIYHWSEGKDTLVDVALYTKTVDGVFKHIRTAHPALSDTDATELLVTKMHAFFEILKGKGVKITSKIVKRIEDWGLADEEDNSYAAVYKDFVATFRQQYDVMWTYLSDNNKFRPYD